MDVSIIYVNYRTSGLIADSLRSVRALTQGVSYEVIVVDNNTEKSLPAEFGELFPDIDIKYVMLDENVGFGRANNEGFKIAEGRNLFCLNPDTILLNNAIKILSDYLDAHPDTGIVGGNLLDARMSPGLSYRRFLPGVRWEINELLHMMPEKAIYGINSKYNHSDKPIDVGYITGADLMIRAKIALEVQGFHKDFFMYFEETDLCHRVHKAGYRVVNVPQARIQHLEGRSYDDNGFNPSRLERNEKSRLTYYKLNRSMFITYAANMIYGVFLLTRVLLKRSESYKYRLRVCLLLNRINSKEREKRNS